MPLLESPSKPEISQREISQREISQSKISKREISKRKSPQSESSQSETSQREFTDLALAALDEQIACDRLASGEQTASFMAVMVTRRCNMTCAHCSVSSSPHIKIQPDEETLVKRVHEAMDNGIQALLLTGGEPMLRESTILRLMEECKSRGVVTVISTNGFWGKKPDVAREKLQALKNAGMVAFTLSYDRYHAAYQGPEPALNIARAAEELKLPMNLNITRVAGDKSVDEIVALFEGNRHVRMRFYDVQPVGRAREEIQDEFRSETGGFCNACANPAITEDGRVTACNGPAYFAPLHSPLQIGNLKDAPLSELLARHRDDPILATIRIFGPERLRAELQNLPGFEDFPFRSHYGGMCDLCGHLTSDERAVAALRTHLSSPRHVAERMAMARVLRGRREAGQLDIKYANEPGASRIWLQAAGNGHWPTDTASVLGRADLDWHRQVNYLGDCGLSRPLATRLNDPQLTRWMPSFFAERLRERAMQDGLSALMATQALAKIEAALAELDASGVLLKGAAQLAASKAGTPGRGVGDIDLYVDARAATALRARLLEMGFEGEADALRPSPHHLAPITLRGMMVEIHTHLMPPCWKLPETEMLAHAQSLPGYAHLKSLDAEGALLHTLVHCSRHLFAHGLKTAWDVNWLLQQQSLPQQSLQQPQLDWERLARWASTLAAPRAFWTPLTVLARELKLAIPAEFLKRAPHDDRARRLEAIAASRIFRVTEDLNAVNVFSRVAVFWLLHDNTTARLRYFGTRFGGETREARRGTRQDARKKHLARQANPDAKRPRSLSDQWREAVGHWHAYRRA